MGSFLKFSSNEWKIPDSIFYAFPLSVNEPINEAWSARTVDRNIVLQYYCRLLQSQYKQVVKDEM